ncbi:hypothetical protein Q9L58_009399, partial [Maublancomyces gigas]
MICYKDGQQSRRLETFHYGSRSLTATHPEPIDYLISQLKELEVCWNDAIRKCKSVLADVNRGVLEESFGEIDRKLVRGLYKYAQTWEELRRVHTQQLDALQVIMEDGANGIWFSTNQVEVVDRDEGFAKISAFLRSFSMIEKKIKKELVEETSELISRTHSIISIDEAYRSRDQNESIKRLSWITFIFLPLLFVASLFGMNVDLVQNNPSWIYYIYISIPMFLLLLLSVWILKQLKGVAKTLSGWVVEARNRYPFMLRQRVVSDEETKAESNHEHRRGFNCAVACGDASAVTKVITERAEVKSLFLDAMRLAAEYGHQAVLKILLENGADLNGRAGTGEQTPLQATSGRGHLAIVDFLLAAGAEINAAAADNGGCTALQSAAGVGHLSIVERLILKGADVNAPAGQNGGRTALQAAAWGGHLSIVEMLLARGADINALASHCHGWTALQAAACGGQLSVVEMLLAKGADVNAAAAVDHGRTALQAAASGGHLAVVEILLAKGADVNAAAVANGRTALQAAAEGAYVAVVEVLIASRASVNAAAAVSHGRTALQAAAGGGHLAVVESLIGHGADVNAAPGSDAGRTAVQAAAGGGHVAVVESLIGHGADVNAAAVYYDGRTALQAAAGGGHLAVVESLIGHGADVNAAPAYHNGRTVLQAAAGGGHLAVVESLIGHGADVNAAAARHGRTALQA